MTEAKKDSLYSSEKDVTEARKNTKRGNMKEGQVSGRKVLRLPGCLAAAALLVLQRPGQGVREREERAATSRMRRAQSGSHW